MKNVVIPPLIAALTVSIKLFGISMFRKYKRSKDLHEDEFKGWI